jgi:hypothetical protein
MPFDGVDFARHEKVLDKLDEVIGLLGSEDHWCQKALRTDDGRRCIVGAMVDAKAKKQLYGLVLASARDVTGVSYTSVERFNDDSATDHRLVLAVLDDVRHRVMLGEVPSDVSLKASFLQRIMLALKPVGA